MSSIDNAPTDDVSFAEMDQTALLEHLKVVIKNANNESIFAFGGSIPFSEAAEAEGGTASNAQGIQTQMGHRKTVADPISLYWDTHDEPQSHKKVVLPTGNATSQKIQALIKDCTPATFGRGQEDVLDEGYRKAVKLDVNQFATNFSPYDFGIVDEISQLLLPSIQGKELQLRGVHAELYKLNVYSGPSGMFKAHVDTPRSLSQFGSLVVCLPVKHEGGDLLIRHANKELRFDWAKNSNSLMQWAAFYSDCEHEVLPVTSGHRITLTYNLYLADHGHLTSSSIRTPQQLPLYQCLKNVLRSPKLMPNGGDVGVVCRHHYAHHNKSAIKALPETLKGIDMAVFQVCKALGFKVSLQPLLNHDLEDLFSESDFVIMKAAKVPRMLAELNRGPDFEYRGRGEHFPFWSLARDGEGEELEDHEARSRDRDLTYGMVETIMNAKTQGFKPGENMKQNYWDVFVDGLRPLQVSEDQDSFPANDNCKLVPWKNIHWLMNPAIAGNKDLALANIAYGNQACLELVYSTLAMVITVPPMAERSGKEYTSLFQGDMIGKTKRMRPEC